METKRAAKLAMYLLAMGAASYLTYVLMKKARTEFQEAMAGTEMGDKINKFLV